MFENNFFKIVLELDFKFYCPCFYGNFCQMGKSILRYYLYYYRNHYRYCERLIAKRKCPRGDEKKNRKPVKILGFGRAGLLE